MLIWVWLRRSRAKTVKKCTKKCDARAKLLFCFLNVLFFFCGVLVAVESMDLKVPSVNLQIRPESFRFFLLISFIFNSVNSEALVYMRKPNSEGFKKRSFAR